MTVRDTDTESENLKHYDKNICRHRHLSPPPDQFPRLLQKAEIFVEHIEKHIS